MLGGKDSFIISVDRELLLRQRPNKQQSLLRQHLSPNRELSHQYGSLDLVLFVRTYFKNKLPNNVKFSLRSFRCTVWKTILKNVKYYQKHSLSSYVDFDYYFTSAQTGLRHSATATKHSCHEQPRPISAGQVQVVVEKGMPPQNRAVGFISQGRSTRDKMLNNRPTKRIGMQLFLLSRAMANCVIQLMKTRT